MTGTQKCEISGFYYSAVKAMRFWHKTRHLWQMVSEVSRQLVGHILKGQAVQEDWLLRMGPVGIPEKSLADYQPTLSSIPEQKMHQMQN